MTQNGPNRCQINEKYSSAIKSTVSEVAFPDDLTLRKPFTGNKSVSQKEGDPIGFEPCLILFRHDEHSRIGIDELECGTVLAILIFHQGTLLSSSKEMFL